MNAVCGGKTAALARMSAACGAAVRVLESTTTRSGTRRQAGGESKNTPSLLVFAETLALRPRANGVRRDAVAGRPVGKAEAAARNRESRVAGPPGVPVLLAREGRNTTAPAKHL